MRYRWSDGPNDFAAPLPRPGATLRSPIADDLPRRRGTDQVQPSLLCKIGQNGQTGEWSGEDADGNPLIVQNGSSGLEIFIPGEAEGDQGGDPAVLGAAPPGALDRAPRAHDRTRPGQERGQLQALQQYLNKIHEPRS